MSALVNRPWWQTVSFIACMSYLLIQISGFIGTNILSPTLGWGEGASVANEHASNLEGRFVRWDSGYYLQIAQHGYQIGGVEKGFFPAYPLLSRVISQISGLSILTSGWLLSLACFLAATHVMYRWVIIDHGSSTALWSVIWLCISPLTFFFVAFYAEPIFLLASLFALLFARQGRFVASGLAIAVAGASRPIGFLLAVPYVLEFVQEHQYRSQWLKFCLGAMVAPLGTLAFLSYLAWREGSFNLLAVYTSGLSAEWKTYFTWPWITLTDSLQAMIFGRNINQDWFSRALVSQDTIYAITGLIMAVWAGFKLRLSLGLYLVTGVLFLWSNHGPYGYAFWSIPRHILALAPIYLVAAHWIQAVPTHRRWLPAAVSLLLLIVLSAWFASGRWVA